MRKAQILLLIGIWIAVLPYLGFPYSLKDILGTISGFGIICLSYFLYKDHAKKHQEQNFDNFSENNDFQGEL